MNKKLIFLLPAFMIILFLHPLKSFALGIGPFTSFGIGHSTYENGIYDDTKEFDLFAMRYTFGLVMDTAVAMDKVFNYRMYLGYGFGDIEVKKESTDTRYHHIYDLSMYNDFGFGIIKTQYIRFWLGPQFGIRYSNETNVDRYWEFGMAVGLVMGININIEEVITIFFDGGVRFHISFAERPFFHYGYEGFINGGIMFRIEDTYSSSKS